MALAQGGVVTVHRDIMDEFVKRYAFLYSSSFTCMSKTVIKELENIGKTWSEAEKKNRVRWRAMGEALCFTDKGQRRLSQVSQVSCEYERAR